MKERTLIAMVFGLLAGMVLALSSNLSAQPGPAVSCQEAKTIFRDSSRFSRRKYGAENMSEKHNDYTREGWKFVDMEIYTENGDLEGFFLTYTREIACTQTNS